LRLALSKKDFGGSKQRLAGWVLRGCRAAKLTGHSPILGSTKLAKLFAFTSFAPHGAILDTYL